MATTPDTVLLWTHQEDVYTVDRVAERVTARGAHPIRVDADRFPTEAFVSAWMSGSALRYELCVGLDSISPDAVRAVWTRQLWNPKLDADLPPEFRAACERNALHVLGGFLDGLTQARWVNSLPSIQRAANKLCQLRLARQVGLPIPRTLVTNRPADVRSFFDEVDGHLITKLPSSLTTSMQGAAPRMRTSAVRIEDLAALDRLRHCPMIFQEQVAKDCELRIAYVEGQCFVGAVRVPALLDWRGAPPADTPWQADQLPAEIQRRLSELMRTLGLVYGAIDMIRTPQGEHVFLEVNPTGEWGMLERDLRLPIADALAAALLADTEKRR
jgi:glutathione synthase/RimK-type ligase-like ATP-grasp enzyme